MADWLSTMAIRLSLFDYLAHKCGCVISCFKFTVYLIKTKVISFVCMSERLHNVDVFIIPLSTKYEPEEPLKIENDVR